MSTGIGEKNEALLEYGVRAGGACFVVSCWTMRCTGVKEQNGTNASAGTEETGGSHKATCAKETQSTTKTSVSYAAAS